jgi:hypothetical protein
MSRAVGCTPGGLMIPERSLTHLRNKITQMAWAIMVHDDK